jgi:pyruvate/2-oxoglutarate dehydrogenase complex dihydrolipoamide dehydrogenase (E3) component
MHPSGALAHLAAAVKKAVKVPVIACGKINDPLMAERFLEEGVADFIAVGRQLLADPEWPNKAKQGRLDEINQCINCNGCFYTILMQRSPLTCTINPAVGREEEFQIRPARSPKKVMVIGGGLAGMETARIAAERGHQVSLYEKSDKLGGQWNIGSQQEYKQHFGEVTQRKSAQLTKAGVRVLLNQEVTREMVEKTKPDVVVLATGAIPATLEAPGADGKNVVQANDVILGKARVGQRVVVIGGRYVGMEVALALAEQGKRVHLLTRRMLGRDTEANILETLRDKLFEAGGHITEDTAVVEITSASVKARVKYSPLERPMVVPADTVVLAVGDKAENRLARELHGVAPEVYSVGDCVEPRDAMHAIREGAEVGLAI